MSSWTSGLTDNWRLKISYSSQLWKRLASWPSLSVIYHTSRKATCFPAISATQNSFGYTALAECASHFRCMLPPMYLVDISGTFHVAGPSFTASECCHSAPTLLALSRAYWNMCVASLPGDLRIRSTIKHLYTHGRLRHKSPSGSWGLFVHPVGTSYSPDSLHHLICSPDFACASPPKVTTISNMIETTPHRRWNRPLKRLARLLKFYLPVALELIPYKVSKKALKTASILGEVAFCVKNRKVRFRYTIRVWRSFIRVATFSDPQAWSS